MPWEAHRFKPVAKTTKSLRDWRDLRKTLPGFERRLGCVKRTTVRSYIKDPGARYPKKLALDRIRSYVLFCIHTIPAVRSADGAAIDLARLVTGHPNSALSRIP